MYTYLQAAKGLSLMQIKSVSRHSSDTVVQEYIESGTATKRTCADALRLPSSDDANDEDEEFQELKRKKLTPPHVNEDPLTPESYHTHLTVMYTVDPVYVILLKG